MYMRASYCAAARSTDRSTANGAILVDDLLGELARGFNHHVAGYGHLEAHHERPLKYSVTEHAERDVLLKAASFGVCTSGKTMVANWAPCPDCARAIYIAGVTRVICHEECMARTPARWAEMVNLGLEILAKNNVELVRWSGKVGRVENLNNGEIWYP